MPLEKPKMWKEQRGAYKFVKKRGPNGVGLFMGCGTGKSRIIVEALEDWMAEENVKLVLIVNILTGLHVWIEQWNLWATYPVVFVDLNATGAAGLKKAKALAANGYPVICLINPESTWQLGHKRIPRKRDGKIVKILEPVDTALYDADWDAVIVDESNCIGSPSAKVTKFMLKKIKPRARFRIVATASAYTKRPLDVYTQLKFILPEGSKLLPPTFTHFKAKYAIPHPGIRGATIGWQNLDDLVDRMATCCVMLKKEDVLDLPPALHLPARMLTLPPKVRKLYDQVTDELYAELEDFEAHGGTVSVNHIFAVMRKQMQMTSGFIKMDPTEEKPEGEILELGDWKIQEVLRYLDLRAGEPTLVVTQADHEERMLARAIFRHMKFRPKILNGSVHGSEARHKLVRSASTDPVFIVKEAVAARSVDMQFADMTIFYSHNPHTINYEQILSRNHRGTQKKSISYVHLLVKNSVDTRIMKILNTDLAVAAGMDKYWRTLLK